jgi:ribosomal protein S18 acetylase RimI-like enzyme
MSSESSAGGSQGAEPQGDRPAASARGSRDAVVATTEDAARALRSRWLEFRGRFGQLTPDADPDFFLGIYRELGEGISPHVAWFSDARGPYALLVGRTLRASVAARIGYVPLPTPPLQRLELVYGGIVTDGSAGAGEAVQEYLRSLLLGPIELIDIHYLDSEHELLPALCGGLLGRPRVTVRREPHHFLALVDPATGERRKQHSRKTRSKFRRRDLVLVEHFGGEVELRTFTDASQTDAFLAQCDRITARSYQAAIGSGVRQVSRWKTIIETLARQGRLRGYVLAARGEPIAYVLGSLFGSRFTLTATAFDPEHRSLSAGQVLLNRVIDELAAERVAVMDLGFGDAEYKRMHATETREEATLHLYGRSAAAAAAFRAEWLALGANAAARRMLGGWLRVVKRGWRKRLEAGPDS